MIKTTTKLEQRQSVNTTMTITINQAIKDVGWTSKREPTDESSTKSRFPYGQSQQSYGQGLHLAVRQWKTLLLRRKLIIVRTRFD